MWQPGWQGSLGESGYMYMYGWVPLLPTWNYHNTVNWLSSNTNLNFFLEEEWVVGNGEKSRSSLWRKQESRSQKERNSRVWWGAIGHSFSLKKKKILWSRADLQCCVNFCSKPKSLSFIYINVYLLFFVFFPITVYHGIPNTVTCAIQ